MAVDRETVAQIARLARIRITEEEGAALTGELSNILAWVEQLGELESDDVPPMTSVVARELPLRADEVSEGGEAEAIVKNAPEPAHGFFTVPKVVE
ncbi:MAG: Asp-tRNA(Asn)/Glu-tRNA(Gln) amidotransferase subunit GatC [Kiloniellales bacterium]|jgi:aspartyl-tRNA(Asn)/glutamyl-tRNA(Gln) amidotransferase subunit C|nr:Asp-tRNA(Asn)/Glu-tRNA(Gln) amidotransferase subunit GatC [Kiloniellales bacterium]